MLYYHYIIASILGFIFINFIVNMFFFRNIRNYSLPQSFYSNPPLVSVLIPARNEEANIYRCVSSFLRQDYKNIEIIVLDDNSCDATSEIVGRLSEKDSRIKLVRGRPLKKGWMGKCWACQQLSWQAKGQYIIFTDADTVHSNDTVSRSLAAIVANKLDAISVYPKQITVTLHERMTVPFINFAILSFMPLVLVRYAKGGFLSTGIGQFFMFKKQAYSQMGGHESIKSEVLEDIHLSKQIKKSGFKYMVFDGSENIFCRMYRDLKEVMNGFTKFIYAAFNYSAVMEAVAMTAFSVFFLFPFVTLPLGMLFLGWSSHLIVLNIIQVIIILAIKIVLALRFKIKILDAFLMPVSICYMLVIAVNSYVQAKFRKGISWKGRTYNITADDDAELVDESCETVKY
ncbi:MAG: glycosyltransferase [Actinobacteria bacterium]|nr:glycosyltransferase [Actinomycetota bacterium]